ncbi:E3 ubiquitin-protein ligase TRIM45-like [Mytilus edulis]|uniref:E3 ubiquitin-protein ligase TRIM45-like n=1 Tax=Mytilus edulis TaxID=6550 RepID=UPI0039EE9A8A
MATSIEVKDELSELLTCPICLETFHVPKYLPCLHTFCQSCISTFILSSVTKEKDKGGFECPICRKLIQLQGNPGVPETWADQLPINHLITSMMDLKDITRSEKMCNACQLSNISKKAEYWCTVCCEAYCPECTNYHRKFRMTLNHKIISIEELKSSEGVVGTSGIVFCDEHPDKAIEVFCEDHSKPCCTLCATLNHRKCEIVTTIDKAITGIKTATQTKDLLQKLQQFSQEVDSPLKIIKNNKTEIETESSNIILEIDSLKRNFIKHLERMENEIKEELSTKKGEILKDLENEAMGLTSLKCTVDNWKRIMDTCIKHGSELQCLTEVNRLLIKKDELDKQRKDAMSMLKIRNLKFQPIDFIKSCESNKNWFGSLSVYDPLMHEPSVNMQTGNIEIVYTCLALLMER